MTVSGRQCERYVGVGIDGRGHRMCRDHQGEKTFFEYENNRPRQPARPRPTQQTCPTQQTRQTNSFAGQSACVSIHHPSFFTSSSPGQIPFPLLLDIKACVSTAQRISRSSSREEQRACAVACLDHLTYLSFTDATEDHIYMDLRFKLDTYAVARMMTELKPAFQIMAMAISC